VEERETGIQGGMGEKTGKGDGLKETWKYYSSLNSLRSEWIDGKQKMVNRED